MSRLTKKNLVRLESILHRIERAERYIKQPDVAIAKRGKATTTLHYTRQDGEALYEVSKEAGSELANLFTAKNELQAFIKEAACH